MVIMAVGVIVAVAVRVIVIVNDCAHFYFLLALTSAGWTSLALFPQELRV